MIRETGNAIWKSTPCVPPPKPVPSVRKRHPVASLPQSSPGRVKRHCCGTVETNLGRFWGAQPSHHTTMNGSSPTTMVGLCSCQITSLTPTTSFVEGCIITNRVIVPVCVVPTNTFTEQSSWRSSTTISTLTSILH